MFLWWKPRLLPRHLPCSEGPYAPGCFDLMTEYSPDGCFARIYYPTSDSDIKVHFSRWIPWLPNGFYLQAFAYVLSMWTIVIKLLFKLLARGKQIPVIWKGDVRKEGGKLPVIILSHGLGASRFFYSCICCELASRGFVVAAVEHREKSACTSFYYASPKEKLQNKPTTIPFERVPFGKNHLATRQRQVRHRVKECQRVVDLLEALNAGKSVENILGDQFDLGQFKGRLDFSKLVMMGHSFGGATAIRTLGSDARFKVGVILDAWVFPVKEDQDLETTLTQPLIFINTQTFQIRQNISVMKRFMTGGAADKVERSGYTIRLSTHEHQTDTPFLVGCWLNFFMKKIDSLTAIKINNHLIVTFLQKYVDMPSAPLTNEYLNQQEHNIARSLSV